MNPQPFLYEYHKKILHNLLNSIDFQQLKKSNPKRFFSKSPLIFSKKHKNYLLYMCQISRKIILKNTPFSIEAQTDR